MKRLILVSVLILLLASAVLQLYTMYKMSTSPAYVLDSTNKATTIGVDVAKFWKDNQWMVAAPSATSLISMALLGVLFIMS